MNSSRQPKQERAMRRARRVRSHIHGTAERPRLSVKRSLKHISAQAINDSIGTTLISAGDHQLAEKAARPIDRAKQVGKLLGERLMALGIQQVIFDRGSYRYHGRVAALAEGAREAGLNF